MKRKDETLQENLIALAHEIILEQGLDGLNMRALAKRANIASGTVYNYFTNKDDLLLAMTEKYWQNALTELKKQVSTGDFLVELKEIFHFLTDKLDTAAFRLMGSLSRVEKSGRLRMIEMQKELKLILIEGLEKDSKIAPEVWNEHLSKEQFADFIILNMLALLQMKVTHLDTLLEIIKKIIY